MSRTVAALYDSRAEAETAHARLSAEVKAEQVRIITRETAAALGTFKIRQEDADGYRQGLARGAFLLIGEVASGEDPNHIVRILQGTRAGGAAAGLSPGAGAASGGGTLQEARIPQAHEELRIDKREVVRGGARVRSFTREEEANQSVFLKEEHIEAGSRAAERRLTPEEVQRGGLLKERVIEVSEMREEPVITKEAFVREEVVLTKTVSERVETIHDTLRRTEVAVEDIPPPQGPAGR